MKYTYKTKQTCATTINFDVTDGIVHDVTFIGGCQGNLKAIPALIEGMEVKDVVEKLKGITCGMRSTSCADQLATALIHSESEA